eukprot:15329244-Ditylum_brightwellii.AAC.1
MNLDTMQQEVKKKLQNLTKAVFSHSSLQLSSLPIPTKHFYKPGCTMCLVQGKINSRKMAQGVINTGAGATLNSQQWKTK